MCTGQPSSTCLGTTPTSAPSTSTSCAGDQVAKAIADHAMLVPGDRVLVAVSGGKDRLAVWDILLQLGYQADGLYLGLGIGGYSDSRP